MQMYSTSPCTKTRNQELIILPRKSFTYPLYAENIHTHTKRPHRYGYYIHTYIYTYIQLRMNYTYKEEVLPRWDADAGFSRPEDQGGPDFTVGMIGAPCAHEYVMFMYADAGFSRPDDHPWLGFHSGRIPGTRILG
jgi:hypothetical protein